MTTPVVQPATQAGPRPAQAGLHGLTLFRAEAAAAGHRGGIGSIRLAAMPGSGWVVACALAAVALLIMFAVWGESSRKVVVGGVLQPPGGLLHLAAPVTGRLAQLHVADGQTVKPGDLLAIIDTSLRSDFGDTATLLDQGLAARRAALADEARGLALQAQQRHHTLGDRLLSLQRDTVQAEGEADLAQRRLALAERSLQRDQALSAQGFLSGAHLDSRHAELLDLQARARQARRALEALQREAGATGAEIEAVRLQVATQLAQLERVRAGLAQEAAELAARRVVHLTAPASAVVGAISAQIGHQLQAGQTVLSLLPVQAAGGAAGTSAATGTGPARTSAVALQAHLYAPSRAAGTLAAGQDVWLRLQAFPYQKFGLMPGRVAEVSRTPVLPADLPAGLQQVLMNAARAQEPLYRVTVELDALGEQASRRQHPLKAGMLLEADVVQERRAIWEWVLEPLLATNARWQVSTRAPASPPLPGGG